MTLPMTHKSIGKAKTIACGTPDYKCQRWSPLWKEVTCPLCLRGRP